MEVLQPPTFTFPPIFDKLKLTLTNIRTNISERSHDKAMLLSNHGDSYVIGSPVIKGKCQVVFVVRSQSDCLVRYEVTIQQNVLSKFKNKREAYKNFKYNCTCKDMKVVNVWIIPRLSDLIKVVAFKKMRNLSPIQMFYFWSNPSFKISLAKKLNFGTTIQTMY